MVKITVTKQQNDAINFQAEHVLIKGAPGSGKTTVLLMKIEKILQSNQNAKILLITYNKTLAAYAQKYLADRGYSQGNLEVRTFHSWASKYLRQIKGNFSSSSYQVDKIFDNCYENQKTKDHRFYSDDKFKSFLKDEIEWIKGKGIVSEEEYLNVRRSGRMVSLQQSDRKEVYTFMEQFDKNLAMASIIPFDEYGIQIHQNLNIVKTKESYEYVMIDEAQDLTQVQLIVLRELNPKSLIISADIGQRIYKTDFTWKSVGINIVGGRTKHLEEMHRSCQEIVTMARPLYNKDLNSNSSKNSEETREELIVPKKSSGFLPEIHQYGKHEEEYEGILRLVRELWNKTSDKDITIGVLCRHKMHLKKLKGMMPYGIPHEHIEKENGSCLTPGVKFVTMHSAKGLEFDVVIIPRFTDKNLPSLKRAEAEEEVEDAIQVERRLLYVSMTRAKTRLFITGYGNKMSRFIEEFEIGTYNHVSY
ncbi:3'-5' exonuclease [Exiguobacterium mexicanum]|uniref:3'-5' exonuclease n=1 Tax=Exiguobacterium mexicanum TaxID=340146 RepID=UPI00110E10F9|nr:3'-5' exonuclease [Exiguobacterium mexicanum]